MNVTVGEQTDDKIEMNCVQHSGTVNGFYELLKITGLFCTKCDLQCEYYFLILRIQPQ